MKEQEALVPDWKASTLHGHESRENTAVYSLKYDGFRMRQNKRSWKFILTILFWEYISDLCEISEQKHRIFFLLLWGFWLSQSHELRYPTKKSLLFSKQLCKKKKKKKSKQRIMCTKCSIYFQSCSQTRSEPQIKASGPKGDIFICDALFTTSDMIYVQPQLCLRISIVNQA